jgi:hypothetical protein
MTNERRHVSTCRWARPTLSLPNPAWLEAADRPWACLRPAGPGPLESAEICETCPNWQPKHLTVEPASR